jgi:uncharacterized protein GlcG (DUF336 family)
MKVVWRIALTVLALLDAGCMVVAAEPLEDPKNCSRSNSVTKAISAINRRAQSGMFTPQNPMRRCG